MSFIILILIEKISKYLKEKQKTVTANQRQQAVLRIYSRTPSATMEGSVQ